MVQARSNSGSVREAPFLTNRTDRGETCTERHLSNQVSAISRNSSMLTFDLLLRGLDVSHHAWHVYTVPVQVFQKDVGIPASQRASLEKATTTHRREYARTNLC